MALETGKTAQSKLQSRCRILALLRQRPMSRAELSRQIGLTRAAITQLVDAMTAEGILRESRAQTVVPGPGRNPTLLKICDDAYFAVGICLRRSGCQIGITELSGKMLAFEQVELPEEESPEQQVRVMAEAVCRVLAQTNIPSQKLLGVGISAPGPVDHQSGKILNPPDFPLWQNYPIAQALRSRLATQVWLEKDANAMALHNYMDQDFPGKDNFLLLYVDQGVGSGLISEGRLLRSRNGFSCELGHTSIDYRGPVCSCGNRGCLELYASMQALTERFGYRSWEALLDSADAEQALDLEGEYLAAALVNLSNVVPLEAVVLGGRIGKCSDALLPRIARCLEGRPLCKRPITFLKALDDGLSYVKSACSVVFGHFLGIL